MSGHTDRCPFSDLEGSILTPAGECPCQTNDDVTLALMHRARADLKHEETGRRRWIVNVLASSEGGGLGLIREIEAENEFRAAALVIGTSEMTPTTRSATPAGLETRAPGDTPDVVRFTWQWVCEVVPFHSVVDAVLGQIAPVRVVVERVIVASTWPGGARW